MKVQIQEGHSDIEVIIKCPEVTDTVRKTEALLYGLEKRLACTKNGTTCFVDRRDVLYFESVDKRCWLYTADDVYEVSFKLYEAEELLAEAGFIRSSKSQILNIAEIKSLCPDFGGRIETVMNNGEKLIVSRQYAKILKERLGL
ncbi:MAG: LytTR family transcriptional regulator [Defluviitaleaceae bacterium]|nr:LytTR family transcriptional regulator [Defluviitaleaceae bacterium]